MNYNLPKNEKAVGPRILSFDPGSVNMGISIVEIVDRPRVLCSAVLENPVSDITNLSNQRILFVSEVQAWIKRFKPQAIIAERFQSRGLRGTTIECVSMMLGMLSMMNLPFTFITASTWKNQYQRRFAVDLREVYKEIAVVPHILDSALIGCFGLERLNGELEFELSDIIDDVEGLSLNGFC